MRFAHILTFVTALPALSACGRTPADHMALARENVRMLVQPSNQDRGGTGWVVRLPSGERFTVTNGHVCALAEDGFMVAKRDGSDAIQYLRVIKVSDTTDLCLLTPATRARGLLISEQEFDWPKLTTVGHPQLRPLTLQTGQATRRLMADILEGPADENCKGVTRQKRPMLTFEGPADFCIRWIDSYDTTLLVYGGQSGSPVMDDDGAVVGVVYASANDTHWGLMIPLDHLRQFVGLD
jgi:S1-C subfamily serine protease